MSTNSETIAPKKTKLEPISTKKRTKVDLEGRENGRPGRDRRCTGRRRRSRRRTPPSAPRR